MSVKQGPDASKRGSPTSRRTFLKYSTGAAVVGASGCDGAPDPSTDAAASGGGGRGSELSFGGTSGTEPMSSAGSENEELDPSPLRNAPNVIWISADDLGPRLGAYGDSDAITPFMDAFAERAQLFERAYCQVAICSASRSSILTGVRPSTSGLLDLNQDWAEALPHVTSLPRHLRNQGYLTHGIGKIFDGRSGLGDEPWDKEHIDGRFADEKIALTALSERKAQRDKDGTPFFLAIGFSAPHCPWKPSEKSLTLHEQKHEKLPGAGRSLDRDTQLECYGVEELELSENDARKITIDYYATVTDLDEKIGALLAEIDRLELMDSSIVLVWCGDHGFQLGESDWYGKWSNYDASTRVPLILHVPGKTTEGARSPRLLECVDMYPTLVELTGQPLPDHELEGVSFAPLLEDPERTWKRAAFSQWKTKATSVKTEQYNYIRTEHSNGSFTYELYDLKEDPKEDHNRADDLPDVRAELEAILTAGWRASLPG